jgi:hypothetical protein
VKKKLKSPDVFEPIVEILVRTTKKITANGQVSIPNILYEYSHFGNIIPKYARSCTT